MPVGQRKTAYTDSVTNNIPAPMRKAISRNCTSLPLIPILSPLPEGIAEGTTVYADKGYDSAENRQHLKEHKLLDGIMRKARRNRPLTEAQTKRNRYLSKTRYVVEQSFGTLHRKFRYARAAYFGLLKVSAQSHLKAMCLNLLKAANRLSVPVAA